MSKEFVPHKNVPGPARLDMELADNSGKVNTDPMFIADRLAIINHVMAYSYLIDEGRWDDWFALFSDDIVFENTSPEPGHADPQRHEGLQGAGAAPVPARASLKPGVYEIWSRAIDALGRTQPLDGSIFWNPNGYEWTGVFKSEVTVE